jgi:Zn finger protein HypA/HybF involved in hydrogenase expression
MVKKRVSPIQKVKKVATPPQPEILEEVVEERTEGFKDFRDYLNVFEFNCILPGSGQHIKFKPITVAALKKVLSYDGDTGNAEVITAMFDDLFRVCVLNDDFDPHDLLVFDRYTLLLEIRKKTKGEKSEFEFSCPKCKSQSVQEIDYDDIPILPVPDEIDYIVNLTPDIDVSMKYITRADELEVFDIVKHNTKGMTENEREAESALFMEAMAINEIITPQGVQEGVNIFDKKYLLEQLPQPLYDKIGNWHEENKFGPDLEIKIKCPHCKEEMEQTITNLNFF